MFTMLSYSQLSSRHRRWWTALQQGVATNAISSHPAICWPGLTSWNPWNVVVLHEGMVGSLKLWSSQRPEANKGARWVSWHPIVTSFNDQLGKQLAHWLIPISYLALHADTGWYMFCLTTSHPGVVRGQCKQNQATARSFPSWATKSPQPQNEQHQRLISLLLVQNSLLHNIALGDAVYGTCVNSLATVAQSNPTIFICA